MIRIQDWKKIVGAKQFDPAISFPLFIQPFPLLRSIGFFYPIAENIQMFLILRIVIQYNKFKKGSIL